MNQDDVKAGFIRQRRSLFLISLVFSVTLYFGVDGSAVRLGPGQGAGMSVDLESVENVYRLLGAIWLWFMYRYWVYVRELIGAEKWELTQAVNVLAAERFRTKYESMVEQKLHNQVAGKYQNQTKIDLNVSYDAPTLDRNQRHMRWRVTWSGTVERESESAVNLGEEVRKDFNISGWRYDVTLWGILITAYWREKYLTEYWAVIWISIVPIFVALYRPGLISSIVNLSL